MRIRRTAAIALGAAALALPAGALAHPGKGHANGHANAHANGNGGSHPVMYVFRGSYDGSGLVTVSGGNAFVRKGGIVGQDVQFDLSGAKVSVADTNLDGVADANDLMAGDAVLVQARLPKSDTLTQPVAARMIVDQTNEAAGDSADAPETD